MERIPVARDFMFAPLRITQPGMDIYEAMELLYQRDVPAAIVVDSAEQVVGILTEKDCLRVLSADAYDGQGILRGGTVADYMSPLKAVLAPDMDLFSIAAAFLKINFLWLPVLQDGCLLGCISRKDMLRQIRALKQVVVARRGQEAVWQKVVLGQSELARAQFIMSRK